MKSNLKRNLISVLIAALCLTGCASGLGNTTSSSDSSISSEISSESTSSEQMDETMKAAFAGTIWVQITQEEATRIMKEESGFLIVDVRRQDEYESGHIPGAICVPNESIGTSEIPELPDKDQTLLVYCRSGRRSKEAAQKLADLGYSDVREFGGIIDWTGETVDGKEPGKNSWEGSEDEMNESIAEAIRPVPTLVIKANDHTFYADLEDNSSAEALMEKLSQGDVELELHDYGSFEKVGPLPWDLPRNDESITTVPGDVILYQGNQITIYYDENTWNFTRLAKIGNVTKDELLEVFGPGNVTVTCWIEWNE